MLFKKLRLSSKIGMHPHPSASTELASTWVKPPQPGSARSSGLPGKRPSHLVLSHLMLSHLGLSPFNFDLRSLLFVSKLLSPPNTKTFNSHTHTHTHTRAHTRTHASTFLCISTVYFSINEVLLTMEDFLVVLFQVWFGTWSG